MTSTPTQSQITITQPAMTPVEGIDLLDQLVSKLQLDRSDTFRLVCAVHTVREALNGPPRAEEVETAEDGCTPEAPTPEDQ